MLGAAEVLVDVLQLGTAAIYHSRETQQDKKHHEESIELEKKQHTKDIQLIKQTYLMDVFLNLEQHFQQLNAGMS